MRVKLFWKNDLGDPRELIQGGTGQEAWFKGIKPWKDWWSAKGQGGKFQANWREEISARKAQELEDELNAWLSQNSGVKIVEIKQSVAGGSWGPSRWLVSVWYEGGDDVPEK